MSFLSNPHLDLTTVRIETPRCVLVPFSLDGVVDIHELTDEFCRANRDLYVSPFLPTYEQELEYLQWQIESIRKWEILELFILEKNTWKFIGATGLNNQTENTMNLWLWIRIDEQAKWYATEVYTGLIDWAHEHIRYEYLSHYLNPENTPSRRLAEKFGWVLQDIRSENGDDWYKIYLR